MSEIRNDVAIIGLAGRFPGASNPNEFWNNLCRGVESISRFSASELRVPDAASVAKSQNYVMARAIIADADTFDAAFFGIYPKEAELIDPQQRVFLECCWHAFEDAGYDPLTYPGKVGVYAGCSFNTYFLEALCANPAFIHDYSSGYQVSNFNALLGTNFEFLATRVAYKLNLRGPAFSMNSGCSTSLLAVAHGCLAVQTYQCDMVLAGGVSITFPQKRGYFHEPGGMVSPDGSCRSFDAQAQGTVFGDGAGVVLLRRLEDAIDANDHIYAVIRGFGVNNDGSQKVGFTAPGVGGQAEAIAAAHAAAEVDPESITYVEAHGTGTPLGDPIELAALTQAFRRGTQKRQFCAIGTAKTNVGHLDVAAGVTGLIKTALSLHHRTLTPVMHFNRPNPDLKLETSPFFVNTSLTEWKHSGPLRAGVSAFGIGGTNAHAVLEEAPASSSQSSLKSEHLIVLSAKSQQALTASTRNLIDFLSSHPDSDLSDTAFTLMMGRHPFEVRSAVVGSSPADVVEALRKQTDVGVSASSRLQAAFMFPGQGSQHVNMGRQLYRAYPDFRKRIDECCEILRDQMGFDLRSAIFQPAQFGSAFSRRINETAIAQPALFAVEYSLARLWMSWGVEPAAMIGHSVGEYVAACLAGVLSVEDALGLIAFRGRLMQELPEGRMLAVRADQETARPMLGDRLSIAAINSPSLVVLSGPTDAIEQAQIRLSDAEIPFSQLHTSHAFHSEMMEPIRDRLVERVGQLDLRAPSIPYVSGVSGDWITAEEVRRPEYWFDHLRKPVLFSNGVAKLRSGGFTLLEVGPGRTLSTLARQHRPAGTEAGIVWSLPDAASGESEESSILSALGRLWCSGATVDWSQMYVGERRSRVALPGYPFERKRFWFEAKTRTVPAKKGIEPPAFSTQDTPSAVSQVYDYAMRARLDHVPQTDSPIQENVAANVRLPATQSTVFQLDKTKSQVSHHVENKVVSMTEPTTRVNRIDQIKSTLGAIFEDLSGIKIDGADASTSFLELGFDSLFLTQVAQALQAKFGLKITFRQLLDQESTIDALSSYVDQRLPQDLPPLPVQVSNPSNQVIASPESTLEVTPAFSSVSPIAQPSNGKPDPETANDLERIMRDQLRTLSDVMARQLDLLRGSGAAYAPPPTPAFSSIAAASTVRASDDSANVASAPRTAVAVQQPQTESIGGRLGQFKSQKGDTGPKTTLTPSQEKNLKELIDRYTARTAGSKRSTQENRATLADPRVAAGFRSQWKEMVYPIVTNRSRGSKIRDIDGNEYIDVVNGYGPIMLGHSPDFVIKAVEEQLKQGIETGPQSPLAGEVARLVCEMTGMERATFCNTGSEAVTAALRVARTVTGRNKVVLFTGSYHGMFDEVLVKGVHGSNGPRSLPIAPGIPREKVENVIVLDYGTQASLEYIKEHASQLAAVLIEPIQSRHPALKPVEFLKELREVTAHSGTAFIFDEVVTGFRVHQGGAQALLGIRADLATYGKVIGGGMPIGVLAGKASFMDALDGGMWNYGDDSFPEVGVTFFAGTFVRHPLALAATRAVLTHLRAAGPNLQEGIANKTAKMVDEISGWAARNQIPIQFESASSIAYFSFPSSLPFASLFYYYMRCKGVYIQEGFPVFLTTEHSDQDVALVIRAFQESMTEMQAAGFLPPRADLVTIDGKKMPSYANGLDAAATSGAVLPIKFDPIRQPLTESQTEIWLSARMSDEASCSFNESFVLKMRGELDVPALLNSVQTLVDRHDTLRATFDAAGQYQTFATNLKIEIPLVDLSGFSSQEAEEQWARMIADDACIPFDLINGPVIRPKLIKLDSREHRLMITTHHIVCDGWSTNVLLDELSKLYSSLRANRAPALTKAMQFSEYAHCQSTSAGDRAAAERYWVGQFTEAVPVLDLPTDRPRPALKSFRGSTYRTTFGVETYQKIKRAGARQRCTLFTTLLAGFYVLLARLGNEEDIAVGIPTAGQSLVEGDGLVGHCVNFLPVRARLTGKTTFSQFLGLVKDTVVNAYDHQNYTYGALLRKLDVRRDPGRLPLMEVQFNLERVGAGSVFSDLEVEVDSNPKSFVNFDLFLNMVESEKGLKLDCDYNTELFDESTIARWLDQYRTLLESLTDGIDELVSKIPLISESERRKMLLEWNDPPSSFPAEKLVHQLVEDQVHRSPGAVAVEFEGQCLTYSELDRKSNQLANYLKKLGVAPRTLIGIFLERSLDIVPAVLGVLKAGCTYVPLDPIYPAERLEFIFRETQARLVLTQSGLVQGPSLLGIPSVALDTEWSTISKESEDASSIEVSSADLAYLIYTSGSTGKPKGVEIPHHAVVNLLCAMRERPGIKQDDVLLAVTTLSFDIAGLELILPLCVGAKVVVATREAIADGSRLLAQIKSSGTTVLQATPTTWKLLLEAKWAGNPRLKMLCGGETLPRGLADRLLATGGELWNMYGPTETTIWSAVSRVESGERPVTIGRPIANTQFYVLDSQLQLSPVGVPGELYIGGDGVARGYFKRPELTSEKFVRNPFDADPDARIYKTGDLVRRLPDGSLSFLGRLDTQIKFRGFRIEIGEIEHALGNYHKVAECAVTLHADKSGDQRLVAYVVGKTEQKPSVADLQQYLRQSLPDYMVPAIFVFADKLPLTPNGKLDRKALPAPSEARIANDRSYVAPSTPAEKTLAAIWEQVLGRERIGIDDDIFQIGGDSLLIFRISARANQAGLRLEPLQIFQHRNVRETARIAVAGPTAAGPRIPAAPRSLHRVKRG